MTKWKINLTFLLRIFSKNLPSDSTKQLRQFCKPSKYASQHEHQQTIILVTPGKLLNKVVIKPSCDPRLGKDSWRLFKRLASFHLLTEFRVQFASLNTPTWRKETVLCHARKCYWWNLKKILLVPLYENKGFLSQTFYFWELFSKDLFVHFLLCLTQACTVKRTKK